MDHFYHAQLANSEISFVLNSQSFQGFTSNDNTEALKTRMNSLILGCLNGGGIVESNGGRITFRDFRKASIRVGAWIEVKIRLMLGTLVGFDVNLSVQQIHSFGSYLFGGSKGCNKQVHLCKTFNSGEMKIVEIGCTNNSFVANLFCPACIRIMQLTHDLAEWINMELDDDLSDEIVIVFHILYPKLHASVSDAKTAFQESVLQFSSQWFDSKVMLKMTTNVRDADNDTESYTISHFDFAHNGPGEVVEVDPFLAGAAGDGQVGDGGNVDLAVVEGAIVVNGDGSSSSSSSSDSDDSNHSDDSDDSNDSEDFDDPYAENGNLDGFEEL